jgi:hypothetical protein
MTKILVTALLVMLAGFVAVMAVPPTLAASALPVPPSFDIAMPAPQAPFDTTSITPFETVGASSND